MRDMHTYSYIQNLGGETKPVGRRPLGCLRRCKDNTCINMDQERIGCEVDGTG
jgi:hypothetical protein